MGFCLINNVAVAASHALCRGANRVAIIDWDVHHGNGTEEIFYADPRVLYVSVHQYPFYPGTGRVDDQGRGDGRGFNVNVPLHAGATPAVYASAFERIVAPIVESYAPDLTLVSAGFDAHRDDPLAGMELDAESYGSMMKTLFGALEHVTAAPRVGLLLEGGYSLGALEASLRATLDAAVRALLPPSESPEARLPGAERTPCSARHERDLSEAMEAHSLHWKLG
jgi:acetoin utilization deacetylase AcuC-like enzyme